MPSMPLITAQGRQVSRRAGPADFGGDRGLGAVGQGVSELSGITARLYDAEMSMRSTRAGTRAAGRLSGLAAEIAATPEYDTYEQRFEAKRRGILDEEGEGLPSGYRDAYEAEIEPFIGRTVIGLRAEGRKKQLVQITADLDASMIWFSDMEARAADDEERAEWRREAAKLLGRGRAAGAIDQKGWDKRIIAYEKAVYSAAFSAGLAADPAATLEALKARAGPFEAMPEDERQAAILKATRRAEIGDKSDRAAIRFQWSQEDRALRDSARMATVEGWNLALRGELTPAKLAELEPYLESSPATFGTFAKIVANGGRVTTPGAPEPAYYAQVQRQRATAPRAFAAREDLDPMRLGNQWEEVTKAQAEILAGRPDAVAGNLTVAAERWKRVRQHLEDVPWYDLGLWEPNSEEMLRLEGEFFIRIDEAQADYFADTGKNARGVEFEKLLDGVVIGMAELRQDDRIRQEVSGRSDLGPVPEATERERDGDLLEGIAPEHEALVRESLRVRGIPATPRTIRELYDSSVKTGAIRP